MNYRLIILFVFFSWVELSGQNLEFNSYQEFTPEEINVFNSVFQYEYNVWDVGGDFTRYVFLNMSKYWPHEIIHRSIQTRHLPIRHNSLIDDFKIVFNGDEITFSEYVNNSLVDGIIIIHNGNIVFEKYTRMRPNDYHAWWSVSKSLVSTSISILEDRNLINLETTIENYLPFLARSNWQGIKVRDILNMSSGIDCGESESDRENPNSCFRKLYSGFFCENELYNRNLLLSNMDKLRNPGETFDYTSVNTAVLKMLIEKVSAKPYAQFIQDEIWKYVGSEYNALLLTTKHNGAHAWMGMNSTLRDLARYGMLYTSSGTDFGYSTDYKEYHKKIISNLNPNLRNNSWFFDEAKYNNYHWDEVYDDGDFVKFGLGGQGLYISPSRNLVIAYFGTHDLEKNWSKLPEFTRLIAKSGIFDH